MTIDDLIFEVRARMQADPEGFLAAARLWWPVQDKDLRKELAAALGSDRAAAAFYTIDQLSRVMDRLAPPSKNMDLGPQTQQAVAALTARFPDLDPALRTKLEHYFMYCNR